MMKEYQKISPMYIAAFVLYVITGLVMFIWPNMTLEILGKALGVGMLVLGLVHIIMYFTKDHLDSIMHMDLTVGVVSAAFGAFMLMHADFVGMALPFGMGVLLLIGGISMIQNALDMKRLHFRRWQILLIISVVLIVCGLVLIYNPFRERVLLYFIAAALIVDGIASITVLLMISNRIKKLSKGWLPKHMTVMPTEDGAKEQYPVPGQMPAGPQSPQAPPVPVHNGLFHKKADPSGNSMPEVPEKITLEMPDVIDADEDR